MHQYELMVILDPEIDERTVAPSLDKFLNEIKRIARVKKGIADSRKSKEGGKRKRQDSVDTGSFHPGLEEGDEIDSEALDDDDDESVVEDWIPGQDVEINYKEVLEILTSTLDSPLGSCPCRPPRTQSASDC